VASYGAVRRANSLTNERLWTLLSAVQFDSEDQTLALLFHWIRRAPFIEVVCTLSSRGAGYIGHKVHNLWDCSGDSCHWEWAIARNDSARHFLQLEVTALFVASTSIPLRNLPCTQALVVCLSKQRLGGRGKHRRVQSQGWRQRSLAWCVKTYLTQVSRRRLGACHLAFRTRNSSNCYPNLDVCTKCFGKEPSHSLAGPWLLPTHKIT